MIMLTLAGDGDGEDVFINPSLIIGIVSNDEGNTDVVCVDQTVFQVKESGIQIFNLINQKFN